MDCRLDGAKPLSEPALEYYQLDPWEQIFSEFLTEIQKFSLKKNTFENVVCEMLSISSRPQCIVDWTWHSTSLAGYFNLKKKVLLFIPYHHSPWVQRSLLNFALKPDKNVLMAWCSRLASGLGITLYLERSIQFNSRFSECVSDEI